MKSQSKTAYEYEIRYSQTAIVVDVLLGLFFMVGGAVLSIWMKEWLMLFLSLIGILMLWYAINRARQQGPKLKIGRHGIWTVETGYLPWSRILVDVKTEANYRTVSTNLVIMNRANSQQVIAQLNTRYLDVDVRSLKSYLKKSAAR